ncbi:MAG: hypothetical protein OXI18_05955 [bacterium]|nr:hypothetical protein [bacterium]
MTPEAVAEYVDADAVVDLLQEAIGIPSVTPHEEDFARWVHDQLDDNAWDHRLLAPFEGTRANVYAGVGHGRPSLVLAGHLDTVHADDWAKHWAGTERANPFAASIIGQEMAEGLLTRKPASAPSWRHSGQSTGLVVDQRAR